MVHHDEVPAGPFESEPFDLGRTATHEVGARCGYA